MKSPQPPPRTAKLDEAVRWYAERLNLSESQIRATLRRARKRGDDAAKMIQLRAADALLKAIDKASKQGLTLEQTKLELFSKLRGRDVGNLDLAIRNGLQFGYNAGRARTFMDPKVLAVRPYFMFDAVLDHRTSKICNRCSKTVLPASSKWWLRHWPPLHHACRSTVRNLTIYQAEQEGIDRRGPRIEAGEGFGAWPLKDPPRLKPNWKELHPELAKVARSR